MSQKTKLTLRAAFLFLCFYLTAVLLSGCGLAEESSEAEGTCLYERSADGLGAVRVAYTPTSKSAEGQVAEYLDLLSQDPEESSAIRLLPDTVSLESYRLEDGVVTLDFSSSYEAMDRTTEVLVRSGYVRTLVQADGVRAVVFNVDGLPLKNEKGEVYGLMDKDTFVENAGKSVNSYQHAGITLYFADSTGRNLVGEGRSIYYSSNKPLEWAIVERVIAGPKAEGRQATVSSDTQILSVATQDKTCYVNLNASFLQQVAGVSPEVAIYSIVDSITRNCDVQYVQFSIEGSSDMLFAAEMDLSQVYEENLDLIHSS